MVKNFMINNGLDCVQQRNFYKLQLSYMASATQLGKYEEYTNAHS